MSGLIGAGLPEPGAQQRWRRWMGEALEVARRTPAGDVPVGAVVFDEHGRVLGTGVNRREFRGDPTAHAEVEAIREAVAARGDAWRLEGCTVVVTLEPCVMCAGAILGARVSRVVFGAWEPRTGACGSVVDVVRDPQWHTPVPEVIGGVREAECAELLGEFFGQVRSQG